MEIWRLATCGHELPGAQPGFQSWGVQFLGLGYCTEQKTDGIPQFRALLRKKLGRSVQLLGGPDPTNPPSGCALANCSALVPGCLEAEVMRSY